MGLRLITSFQSQLRAVGWLPKSYCLSFSNKYRGLSDNRLLSPILPENGHQSLWPPQSSSLGCPSNLSVAGTPQILPRC